MTLRSGSSAVFVGRPVSQGQAKRCEALGIFEICAFSCLRKGGLGEGVGQVSWVPYRGCFLPGKSLVPTANPLKVQGLSLLPYAGLDPFFEVSGSSPESFTCGSQVTGPQWQRPGKRQEPVRRLAKEAGTEAVMEITEIIASILGRQTSCDLSMCHLLLMQGVAARALEGSGASPTSP